MIKVLWCYIFISIISLGSAVQASKADKWNDKPNSESLLVIQQAREKIIARDRVGAIQILTEYAKQQSEKKTYQVKLELDRISDLFLTNEGQKHFELAESIRYSGGKGFAQEYELALKEEPGMWKILINLAVGQLSDRNCDKAQVLLEQAEKANPYKLENSILIQRVTLCQNKTLDLEKKTFNPGEKSSLNQIEVSPLKVIYKAGVAQEMLILNQVHLALQTANEIIQADEKYPMGHYWAWKALSVEPNNGTSEAREYVSLCKNISPTQRRKYYLEPNLCEHIELVEEQIRKAEASST